MGSYRIEKNPVMPDQPDRDNTRRQKLDEVIGAFLIALDSGQNPNPAEWLARHPDLCPELAEFFADRERLDDLVEPLMVAPPQQAAAPTVSMAAVRSSSSDSSPQTAPGNTEDDRGPALAPDDDGASIALPQGTRVRYFGDYELQKVLGEGGMGVVYKARQISLNRPVALKMIKAARFASDDDLRRFQNEAEAVARLDHPNIVPIFEVGRFEDQHYFSMKLIAGASLDKRLKDYTADPRRAARLVAVAAGAIHHAHQRGILHRDLKPANILIDPDGQPHVTDFGLAKRVEGDSELTQSGAILGTPAYMAPEQASGTRGIVTTSTDVHGLGAILFALLTGRAPFGGAAVLDTLEQVRERPPDSPRKLNPRVSRDLDVICLKCLEKDPRRRYASADALAEDLNRWLAGEPIAARPVRNAARMWMWCRRNPTVAAAAGLAAAGLVAVAVLSLLYADRQARLARTEKLRADERTQFANKQAEDAAKISAQDQDLKASLADTNRRLAMLQFERAQRAFESGQANHGLLWLVETWRYAIKANDPAWQNLARTNLSFWRYNCPEIKWVFSDFVAVDPAGKTIVTRHGESAAQLWDVATCRPIGKPMVHESMMKSAYFSPDGKTIVTTGRDRKVRLWEAASAQPIGRPLENQDYDSRLDFSPDGKTVLTRGPGETIQLRDVRTGRMIGSPMELASGNTAKFSPDGKIIRTDAGKLWSIASGNPVQFTSPYRGEHPVLKSFSPDGKSTLTSDGSAKRYLIWDSAGRQPIGSPMLHKYAAFASVFSADGRTIATATSERSVVQLWDAGTGRPIGPPCEHVGPDIPYGMPDLLFSPDGKTLAVRYSFQNEVRLLNAGTGLPVSKPLEHQAMVVSMAFSPDGKTILTGSQDRTARLWDVATGQPLGEPMVHECGLQSAAFCAGGTMILTRSEEGTAWLWQSLTDRPMGQPLELVTLAGALRFSADGRILQTMGRDVLPRRYWDAAAGSPIDEPRAGHRDGPGLQFCPENVEFVDLADDNAARLWDAATGRTSGKPARPEGVSYTSTIDAGGRSARRVAVAHSRDGLCFLTLASSRESSAHHWLRLWSTATDQPIGQPIELRETRCAGFSPDMKTLLVAVTDHVAQLWDAVVARPIGPPLRHPAHGPPVAAYLYAAYSPDGKSIATAGNNAKDLLGNAVAANSTARLWHLPSILDDDFPRMEAWVQTITGLAADDEGNISVLQADTWHKRLDRVRQLGGYPRSDPGWLFDPILYGADPTARARAWMERECWADAESAFSDVIRTRPLRSSAWIARGRFYAMRSEPAKAAGDFARAFALGDRDPSLLLEIAANGEALDRISPFIRIDDSALFMRLLFLRVDHLAKHGQFETARSTLAQAGTLPWEEAKIKTSGAFAGEMFALLDCPDVLAALVRKHRRTTHIGTANNVARYCILRPTGVADPTVLVRLAEFAVNGFPAQGKHLALSTLGAALYRASRFEDAIRRLEEGAKLRNGADEPLDWPFLAMAHFRLGHRDEARRWLDRLRNRQPSNDPNNFWQELEILLLRSEAEAVILYDPVFPADPFAR